MSRQLQQQLAAGRYSHTNTNMSVASQQLPVAQLNTIMRPIRTESEDDEPYCEGESNQHQRTSVKRKRSPGCTSMGGSARFPTESHAEIGMVSFPFLTDDEPCLTEVKTIVNNSSSSSTSFPSSPSSIASSSSSTVPSSLPQTLTQSFHLASKHLFSLSDESRDRGSAKIAVITVSLKHEAFESCSSSSSSRSLSTSPSTRSYTSSFKIDGRKSFSNAPFKKYYRRGVHAIWFAEPQAYAGSALENGRVLMMISQKGGRPNGKGFTGLKHDPSSYSPKHPLLCLSSNSVEYLVSVFINRSTSLMQDESVSLSDWREVDVEVSARFDAGDIVLESLSTPGQERSIVKVQRKVLPQPIQTMQQTQHHVSLQQQYCQQQQQQQQQHLPLYRPQSLPHLVSPTHAPRLGQQDSLVSYHSASSSSSDSPSDFSTDDCTPSDNERSTSTPLLDDDMLLDGAHDQCHYATAHPMDFEATQQANGEFGSLPSESDSVQLDDGVTDASSAMCEDGEFPPEWSWDAVVSVSAADVKMDASVKIESSPLATYLPAEFPSFISAEDFELAAPVLESRERAAKRQRLTIDHAAEPLFPHAHAEWTTSPGINMIHAVTAAPLCSPLADFTHSSVFPF